MLIVSTSAVFFLSPLERRVKSLYRHGSALARGLLFSTALPQLGCGSMREGS